MLEGYLRDHDGVITLAQAAEAGLSRQAVYRRARSGRWLRCSRGVYFADDRPFTDAAREAGITGWKANYRLGRYVIDVAFPTHKLAIETDGWAFHNDQETIQKGRVKQTEIALMGRTVTAPHPHPSAQLHGCRGCRGQVRCRSAR